MINQKIRGEILDDWREGITGDRADYVTDDVVDRVVDVFIDVVTNVGVEGTIVATVNDGADGAIHGVRF